MYFLFGTYARLVVARDSNNADTLPLGYIPSARIESRTLGCDDTNVATTQLSSEEVVCMVGIRICQVNAN
jgi:hypothetical protein